METPIDKLTINDLKAKLFDLNNQALAIQQQSQQLLNQIQEQAKPYQDRLMQLLQLVEEAKKQKEEKVSKK